MTARPLAGVRVVVTRAERQSSGLQRALQELGARVELLPLLVVLPAVDRGPLLAAAARLETYTWVLFTSANAVEALLPHMERRWSRSVRAAAIGQATARQLRAREIEPALVASRSQAEGVLAELLPLLVPGDRVLLPHAEDARPLLREGLHAAGIPTEAVVAYRKSTPPDAPARAARIFGDGELGWVTFTSPSTVHAFAGLFGPGWESRRVTLQAASIGAVTSEALRAAGVERIAEAATPGEEAVVAAIVSARQTPTAASGG